ncbi:MAG TPA: acetyl-CoA carboxylase biotin carboxyl carrier protein [Candidatus Sphingobacterium stercoripullorum]|uniref:Biotin carboxyl carrier protein of acetyl-CoA carboxylase n=1 Tax=Candidatus Sphingobacterium stercoripullorum TaxID=2838759 RepID=A0A9D2AYT1_9SPHI|nr:acetyl-CoA carboxylase biotin carboxyl carrier protein [Candidatus Sphingobacterium stercoripullorum]
MSMNIKEIQELITFVSNSGVNQVSIEEKDFKITIKANQETTVIQAPVAAAPAAAPQPVVQAAAQSAEAPEAAPADANLITVRSPMIGTFYKSPSPDKPAFVNVGDDIAPGQVICIVEAMKLFNEIESEVSGKIVKVLVEDAAPVEYDQPLFLVDPS